MDSEQEARGSSQGRNGESPNATGGTNAPPDGLLPPAHSPLPAADCPLPTADLLFEVEDSGVGIATEQLEDIFEPFHQVGDAARKLRGTGLGLAISRKLIRLMGGELSAESLPGRGSLFRVAVSLSEVESSDDSARSHPQHIIGVKGEAPTLLIVDDTLESRRVLIEVLAPLGFEMREAGSGHEALTLLGEFHPQGVITDMMMPDMDGLELIRRIRQMPAVCDTVVIASSASVYEEDRQRCFAAGCDDFLPKPIQMEQLFEQLQRHLHLEWKYGTDTDAPQQLETSLLPEQLPTHSPAPESHMSDLPPALLDQLEESAICNDITSMERLIEALRTTYPVQAHKLAILAYDYEYERILELVRTGETHT